MKILRFVSTVLVYWEPYHWALPIMDVTLADMHIVFLAVDMTRDVIMAEEDRPPTDGRDSGIGQSAASSSIPSVVIDSSSEATSRVQSGLSKSHHEGTIYMGICAVYI